MAQTVANLTDVLKEAWTSDRLEKQFYDENPFLERIEKYPATMIGEHALVPIHKGRSGGYTSTNAAGGALNAADAQKVDQALYTLVYHWFQIDLQVGALNQAGGNAQSVVAAKDLEIQGAIADLRKQCMRQAVSNSDGVIATVEAGSTTTVVELDPAGYGFDAIVRGWLHEGLRVSVGTTADVDLRGSAAIASVSESSTDPDITLATAITAPVAADVVTIDNPNDTTLANPELEGLRSMVGSTTSAVGGLDPQNAGQEFWAPAKVDTTTTVFSLDLVLDLQRSVFQKTGKYMTYVLTSLKQQQNLYSLLQNQVRYQGELKLGAGNVGSTVWNQMEINAMPDVPDREWYCLTIEDFCLVTGSIKKPTWASDIEGSGGRLRWNQGNTNFVDGVVYPFQVALKRRNSHAAAIGLTA